MNIKNLAPAEGPTNMANLKDDQLLTQFERLVRREREATVEVILHIREISKRGLYAKEAYPSLYSYLTEKYHYSGGAAYRRIQAARVSEIYPYVLKLLSDGKLNLTTIGLISSHLNKENAKLLVQKVIGKSKSVVEYVVADLFGKEKVYQDTIRRLPASKTKTEKTKSFQEDNIFASGNEKDMLFQIDSVHCMNNEQHLQVSGKGGRTAAGDSKEIGAGALIRNGESLAVTNGRTITDSCFAGGMPAMSDAHCAASNPLQRKVKIEFVADELVAKKLERAREILRHKYPSGKLEDIFHQALEDMLEKRDPERKMTRTVIRQEKASKEIQDRADQVEDTGTKTRYIPEHIRNKVWMRDGGRCAFVSPEGRRCPERGNLEIDHIRPWALGGHSDERNLRLLCSTHNKYLAYKTFGKWYVREENVLIYASKH